MATLQVCTRGANGTKERDLENRVNLIRGIRVFVVVEDDIDCSAV